MKFKINNRFKAVLGCLLAVGLLFSTPSLAFEQDSLAQDTAVLEEVADTAASEADTAAAAVADTTEAADAGGDTVAAASSTSSSGSSASSTVEESSQIDPQVYKNMTYYILLFLILCTVVAVIGKVLSIYELTKKMNGKYNPFANNTFQAWLFIIFLVSFLGFVYYSYV